MFPLTVSSASTAAIAVLVSGAFNGALFVPDTAASAELSHLVSTRIKVSASFLICGALNRGSASSRQK